MEDGPANHINFLRTGQAPDFLVCASFSIFVHG